MELLADSLSHNLTHIYFAHCWQNCILISGLYRFIWSNWWKPQNCPATGIKRNGTWAVYSGCSSHQTKNSWNHKEELWVDVSCGICIFYYIRCGLTLGSIPDLNFMFNVTLKCPFSSSACSCFKSADWF